MSNDLQMTLNDLAATLGSVELTVARSVDISMGFRWYATVVLNGISQRREEMKTV